MPLVRVRKTPAKPPMRGFAPPSLRHEKRLQRWKLFSKLAEGSLDGEGWAKRPTPTRIIQ
jgi:hypothetical protein